MSSDGSDGEVEIVPASLAPAARPVLTAEQVQTKAYDDLVLRLSTSRSKPGGVTALVWSVGEFKKYTSARSGCPEIVVCETCVKAEEFRDAEINYGKTKSTTNLVQHLRHKHSQLWQELQTRERATHGGGGGGPWSVE